MVTVERQVSRLLILAGAREPSAVTTRAATRRRCRPRVKPRMRASSEPQPRGRTDPFDGGAPRSLTSAGWRWAQPARWAGRALSRRSSSSVRATSSPRAMTKKERRAHPTPGRPGRLSTGRDSPPAVESIDRIALSKTTLHPEASRLVVRPPSRRVHPASFA